MVWNVILWMQIGDIFDVILVIGMARKMKWTKRVGTSENLDDPGGNTKLSHPYGVKSVGLKNKDCYSFTMVYVTYDISPKYRKCNNE